MAQHPPGTKLDAGKPRASLVFGGFAKALTQVAGLGTYGAELYSEEGWLTVPNGEARYLDAMMRHYLKMVGGEEFDETGYRHMTHVVWNALAVLELKLREAANDSN